MLLFYVTPEGWARFSGTCPPRHPCQGQEAGPRSSRPAAHFPLHQGRLRLLASGACRGAYSSRRRSPSADSSPSFARPAVAAARKQQLKPSTSRVRVQTNRPEEGTWQGQCSTHTVVMQKGLGPASSPQPTGAGRGCSRSSAKSAKSWSICGIRSPFRGAGSLTKSHHLWNQCGAGWFGRWKEEQSYRKTERATGLGKPVITGLTGYQRATVLQRFCKKRANRLSVIVLRHRVGKYRGLGCSGSFKLV